MTAAAGDEMFRALVERAGATYIMLDSHPREGTAFIDRLGRGKESSVAMRPACSQARAAVGAPAYPGDERLDAHGNERVLRFRPGAVLFYSTSLEAMRHRHVDRSPPKTRRSSIGS